VLLVLATIVPSLVTSAVAMERPQLGIEESAQLAAVFHPSRSVPAPNEAEMLPVLTFLDRMKLPDGDVVTDDAYDCMATTIMRSPNPKIYVITNDADFHKVLADPLTWHAHYLVVPPPGGVYNALTAAYPSLYKNGAGFARLVHQFPVTSICPAIRLYKVIAHTTTP
jgi:hypothetical protein